MVALNTKLLEAGPLFAKFRIEYVFEQGLQYIVVLTLRHNERHVTIDESFGGLKPRHEVYLRLSLDPGLDPDQREVMSNGGYHAQGYNGAFGKKIDARGRLPFELGLNRPNSMGVMRAVSLYRDAGPHALLVSLYRLRDWKTAYRHVWHSNTGPGNLNFFARGKEKFLETRLEGTRRHWALALIPRADQKHVRIHPRRPGPRPGGWTGGAPVAKAGRPQLESNEGLGVRVGRTAQAADVRRGAQANLRAMAQGVRHGFGLVVPQRHYQFPLGFLR